MKQGALLESLETILVVTVISALIWLYAEGETISPQSRKVKIRLVPPTAGLVVSMPDMVSTTTSDGASELTVEATILASRGDWPRIAQRLQKDPVYIEVQVPSSASEDQQINLREALNHSALAEVNAFVKEVAPASVTARVQQLHEVPMGIRIDRGTLRLSEEAPPTAEPDRVTVTMPADIAAVVREQKLELIARLNPSDTLITDTPQNVSVKLVPPPLLQNTPFVTLAQENVYVRFIVQQDTTELTLPSVQVQLVMSDDLTRYHFKIDPESQRFIQVVLQGPSDAIKLIQEDNRLVRPSIQIKGEDLASEDGHSALLMIDVPEGVEVISPLPGLTTITYTFTLPNTQP